MALCLFDTLRSGQHGYVTGFTGERHSQGAGGGDRAGVGVSAGHPAVAPLGEPVQHQRVGMACAQDQGLTGSAWSCRAVVQSCHEEQSRRASRNVGALVAISVRRHSCAAWHLLRYHSPR